MFSIPIPELFVLNARDLGSPLLQPLYRRIAASGTTTTVGSNFDVPADQTLIVFNLLLIGVPSGGEIINSAGMVLNRPDGTVIAGIFSSVTANANGLGAEGAPAPAAAGATFAYSKQFAHMIVPPGARLRGFCQKNLAVANMDVFFDVCGLLVPSGNMGRV